MNNILEIKKQNDIKCIIILIITNCANIDDCEYFYEENKCLFINKKVESSNIDRPDDISFSSEHDYNIISKYFTFNLIEKNCEI